MSLSEDIAVQLPTLRRFARALSGSQWSGDSYVAAVLRVVIADPDIMKRQENIRLALYRLLLTIWDSVSLNRADPAEPDQFSGAAIDLRLQAIPSQPRQAFLLTALEGLSLRDAAQVMHVSEEKCQRLIEEAGREIASQMACNVLIIEDEPMIALELAEIVEAMGHTVPHVARTHREAIAAVTEDRPDLVLADIRLADGSSGLEAVQEILSAITLPVVFITAYPERLLTGKRPEPTYLVAKPFQPEAVKALIVQALFLAHTSGREHARQDGFELARTP